MNRLFLLPFLCCLACSLATPLLADRSSDPRPNIILFLADDWGMDQVGAYGSDDYQTPEMDALAATGLRFVNCYGSNVCAPSRRSIMTGRHPFRHGSLDTNFTTHAGENNINHPEMPHLLKQAGYVAGTLGKTDSLSRGWDESLKHGFNFYADSYTLNDETIPFDHETDPRQWIPGVAHEFALDFITRHKDQPFLLYYATTLPHIAPGGVDYEGNPTKWPPIPGAPLTQTDEENYHDWIDTMDRWIGELVDHLETLGIRDNTIILISGDNGTGFFKSTRDGRSQMGGKRSVRDGVLQDGGVHLPLIVNWPAQITAAEAGPTDVLFNFADFVPTFIDLAGGAQPTNFVIDGINFGPYLRGEPWEEPEWTFAQYSIYWMVRDKNVRLDQDGRFYDATDLPFTMPEILPGTETPEQLAAKAKLQAVLDDLVPSDGPTYQYQVEHEADSPYYDYRNAQWAWHSKAWDPTSGKNADPDGDFIPNLFEMAFGFDPEVENEPAILFSTENGALQVSNPPVVSPHVQIQAEVSGDLQEWTTSGDEVDVFMEDGKVIARDLNPEGASPRFIRLRATTN